MLPAVLRFGKVQRQHQRHVCGHPVHQRGRKTDVVHGVKGGLVMVGASGAFNQHGAADRSLCGVMPFDIALPQYMALRRKPRNLFFEAGLVQQCCRDEDFTLLGR